jgi:hypothetical protein
LNSFMNESDVRDQEIIGASLEPRVLANQRAKAGIYFR